MHRSTKSIFKRKSNLHAGNVGKNACGSRAKAHLSRTGDDQCRRNSTWISASIRLDSTSISESLAVSRPRRKRVTFIESSSQLLSYGFSRRHLASRCDAIGESPRVSPLDGRDLHAVAPTTANNDLPCRLAVSPSGIKSGSSRSSDVPQEKVGARKILHFGGKLIFITSRLFA